MQRQHKEPAFIHIGFSSNRWGGWSYREPSDRYTIQILPANTRNPTRDVRGWKLGIAHQGPMKWGSMVFPAPEAAALHACKVVKDDALRDAIVEAMEAQHEETTAEARSRIDKHYQQGYDRLFKGGDTDTPDRTV